MITMKGPTDVQAMRGTWESKDKGTTFKLYTSSSRARFIAVNYHKDNNVIRRNKTNYYEGQFGQLQNSVWPNK